MRHLLLTTLLLLPILGCGGGGTVAATAVSTDLADGNKLIVLAVPAMT